jgi:hypothetical protein
MVRKGEFPRPVRLFGRVGGPAAFRLDEVNVWDERRRTHARTHIAKLAVADPDKFKDDECLSRCRHWAHVTSRRSTASTWRQPTPQ